MSDDASLEGLPALNLARDAGATAAAEAEDMEGKRLIERLHNPLYETPSCFFPFGC